MTTAVAFPRTSWPRRRPPPSNFRKGDAGDAVTLITPATRALHLAVDGRLRGHDVGLEFMAETQKLIGISLEGSAG